MAHLMASRRPKKLKQQRDAPEALPQGAHVIPGLSPGLRLSPFLSSHSASFPLPPMAAVSQPPHVNGASLKSTPGLETVIINLIG